MFLCRRHLLAALLTIPMGAMAQSPPRPVYSYRGAAIRGYDTVAYFTDSRPVRGQPTFSHAWSGATWHFASAANRDLFAANPEKYAPQYGGFCSWAVSEGYEASIDPQAWKIVDGRLFLNHSLAVHSQWEADRPSRISRADANWPAVAAKLAPR